MKNKYAATRGACFVGFVVQAVVNNFLPILFVVLQDEYSLNYEQLGRIILVNFLTQVFVDCLTVKIVARFGFRKTAVLCQAGAAAGLCLLTLLPKVIGNAYIGILLAVIVYAFSSGLMEVILSPISDALPADNKSGTMSLLHSFYCWGQMFTIIGTTLLLKAFGFGGWGYIPLIWAVIPFLNAIMFSRVPMVEPVPEEKRKPIKHFLRDKRFILCLVMMLCAGASEIAMSQWASLFAQRALGISKVLGDILGPCAFALFMGIGRLFYAEISQKIEFSKFVVIMSALCALCYFITAFSGIAALSLLGCAVCGFAVSSFWPGTYSLGAAKFPLGGTAMFGLFAMCGDMGCSLGPWVLGVVANNSNLYIGTGVAAVFPITMLLTALFMTKE